MSLLLSTFHLYKKKRLPHFIIIAMIIKNVKADCNLEKTAYIIDFDWNFTTVKILHNSTLTSMLDKVMMEKDQRKNDKIKNLNLRNLIYWE